MRNLAVLSFAWKQNAPISCGRGDGKERSCDSSPNAPHDDDQIANFLRRWNVDPSVLYRTGHNLPRAVMVLFGEVRSDPLWSIATRYRAC
jgi:hypothetical protein